MLLQICIHLYYVEEWNKLNWIELNWFNNIDIP